MNVKSVEKQEKSTVELVIEVNREEFEAAIEKVYKQQRGQITVPGFRKGHAPRKIIEGMYGSGVFYEDAINDSYAAYYEQAVEQEKLDAVAWPQIEIQEVGKDGYSFKAVVTVRPEVTLGDYKGLTAEKGIVEVTDEDVQQELTPYINRATRVVTVDREAKMGDTVVMDYAGYLNGKAFDGGTAADQSLELGSGSFVPGFEDQLVGVKAGDEKDLDITFPEDYHEDLAGKAVVFKVKVHEIKEKQVPTLDDEFAKDVSEFDTLDEFKKDLAAKLTERREAMKQNEFEQSLIHQAAENMTVEIPEAMIDFQAEQMVSEMVQQLSYQGISFDQYLSMTGMTRDSLKESAHETATERVRRELLMGAVVAAENITISDDEIEAEYERLAKEYSMDVEKVKSAISTEDVKAQLSTLKAEKVITESGKVGKAKKKAAPKKKAEAAEGEEKPKKKTTTKKKTEAAEGEEKPKKTAKKKAEESTEE